MPQSMNGRTFEVGQKVLKASLWGRSPMIEEREVVKIVDGKIYLDGHTLVPLKFPKRVWILDA